MQQRFRIIFLGAGFSKPAGLPLANELFQEIRKLNITEYGYDNPLERDLAAYLKYLEISEDRAETPESIDFEQFINYLDIEHYLGLEGSDTWSTEGNQSQLLIRSSIANILNTRTPEIIPEIYRKFVRKLNPNDTIFTFNYDNLLEKAMESENIPFRLFPTRFSEVSNSGGYVDHSKEEVILIKLHGSIDWFDRLSYEKSLNYIRRTNPNYESDNPIFGKQNIIKTKPLTDGPRHQDDYLANIYRAEDISYLSYKPYVNSTPLILSPSHSKILYFKRLNELWWGLNHYGGYNFSLGVIGYSLPKYDEYARQVLYRICRNYTELNVKSEILGLNKTNIKILDLRETISSKQNLKNNYRFANSNKTDYCFKGLNLETIDWFFEE